MTDISPLLNHLSSYSEQQESLVCPHKPTPKTLKKPVKKNVRRDHITISSNPFIEYRDKDQLINYQLDQKKMKTVTRYLNFIESARLTNEFFKLKKKYRKGGIIVD